MSVYAAFAAVSLAVAAYFGHQLWRTQTDGPTMADLVERSLKNNDEYVNHTRHFSKKQVIKVPENIYVAIGFALGTSIMVIAPEGLIIVDVTESVTAAKEIRHEFRKITDKPIRAIVYTHHHTDHVGGAQGFLEDGVTMPEIWAHYQLPAEVSSFFLTSYGAKVRRSARQFGTDIPESRRINSGLGIALRYDSHGFLPPSKLTIEKETYAKIAGLDLFIHHIPGETSDQIGVWIPQWKAYLSGDDVYRAYPNIYTIRGAPARNPIDWYTSVEKIINLEPEYLIPSHFQPITGKGNIQNILIPYRDGIQFVHDQALRYINKGMTPDEVAKLVQLPKRLAEHPYLRELYGTVPWSVKGVFQLYLGWFSGDPVDLFPLSTPEKASRIVSLAGGVRKAMSEAVKAWNNNDIQWALELSSYVLIVDKSNSDAKKLKIDALEVLASRQINSIARNYYLTSSLEVEGVVDFSRESLKKGEWKIISKLPIKDLFNIFSTMYKPEIEACDVMEGMVQFVLTESNTFIGLKIRNSVAIILDDGKPRDADVTVRATTDQLRKAFMVRLEGTGDFIKELKVEGSLNKFKNFMNCFEEDFQLL